MAGPPYFLFNSKILESGFPSTFGSLSKTSLGNPFNSVRVNSILDLSSFMLASPFCSNSEISFWS